MTSKKKMKSEGFSKASFNEEQEENASPGNIFWKFKKSRKSGNSFFFKRNLLKGFYG